MKTYKPGVPEFAKLEKQQGQLTLEFESFRKNSQRTLMQKEADIYKTVYLEAMEVVEKFAKVYHYTLVMLFNSENIEGEDLQKLQIGLNRVIVYHQTEDDLTPEPRSHVPRGNGSRPWVKVTTWKSSMSVRRQRTLRQDVETEGVGLFT